jgi:GT2 family glycosyltransferase
MSRTTVIIVNYNGIEDTLRCLGSLRHSQTPLRVVVVDNASTRAGIEEVERAFPEVTLLRSSCNLGFGRGNNLGLRWALANTACEYVLLLNNDALVEPGTIGTLEHTLDNSLETGLVTPRIVLADAPEALWYGGGFVDWRKGSARTPGYLGPADAPAARIGGPVTFASGCAMLIRRSVLEQVGGFDPRYFMYEEDVELGLRIQRAGWSLRYVPEAVALHRCQGSGRDKGERLVDILSPDNPRLSFYAFHTTRNTLLTMYTHARGWNALQFAGVYPALFLRRMLRFGLRGRWDGVSALMSGVRAFWRDKGIPFKDELKDGEAIQP